MKTLTLKPATPDLIPDILQLDHICFGGLWNHSGYEREIDSPNSDLLVLQPTALPDSSADSHPPILGMACAWAILDEAHITLLAVHPSYRRQGIATALLTKLLRYACERGLKWATLEVRISNHGAIALYQAFGFETAGQRRNYYQDTHEDALILWRKGLQDASFGLVLEDHQRQIEQKWAKSEWQMLDDHGSPHQQQDDLQASL